eukprot:gene16176-18295_t
MKSEEKLQQVEASRVEMMQAMSNVAHDLKTPLASFMSGIEILKEDLQQ